MSTPTLIGDTPTVWEDDGRLGRFNAWFFDALDRYLDVITRRHKEHAFGDLTAGTIVEIGAGVGANFRYLPTGSDLIAVEPNRAMYERLRRRAAEHDVELELVTGPAEALPLADDSVDTVICSLVLCTVADPDAALREIVRVVRPGGTFRFVEHVAAGPASPRRWIQRAITRPWSWLFQGCRLCRDTEALVAAAGFGELDVLRRRFRRSLFVPVNSAIAGRAVVAPTHEVVEQDTAAGSAVATGTGADGTGGCLASTTDR